MGLKFENFTFKPTQNSILEQAKIEMRSDKSGFQLERKSKTWFFTFLNEYVS